MKKILAIYGSPRKNGITSQICKSIIEGAGESGHTVEEIYLKDLHINHCTGCRKCQETGKCAIRKDDIGILENALIKSDIIILTCPTHWGNLTGHILVAFERLFGFLIKEQKFGFPVAVNGKGKETIIITSCSTSWPFNWVFNQSRSVISRLKEIFKYSRIKIIKKVIYPGTFEKKTVSEKFLQKMKLLGREIR